MVYTETGNVAMLQSWRFKDVTVYVLFLFVCLLVWLVALMSDDSIQVCGWLLGDP